MRPFLLIILCVLLSPTLFGQTRTSTTSKDFKKGQIPIFIDSLLGEQPGEFPSRWDLVGSGLIETMEMDGGPVIGFVQGGTISPLMGVKSYLPTHFTMEFEAYFHNMGNEAISVNFDNSKASATFRLAGIHHGGYLNRTAKAKKAGWKHLSLSFNKRAFKAFIDGERLVNVPNIVKPPTRFSIKALSGNASKNKYTVIRNIRVLEGGLPLYDRLVTDGKFVTNRIQFESGKASLVADSRAVIMEIASVLQAHPTLQLTIEGHTDGDGTSAANMQLGQLRANAVTNTLIQEGIAADRLEAVSFGEGQPVADNDTAEGKFMNRRVVFTMRK